MGQVTTVVYPPGPAAARPTQKREPRLDGDFRSPVIAGGIGLTLMLVLLIGWAHFTMISGAVIAHGQTVVHGKPKMVQSLDGGSVQAVNVAEGDRVKAGQVLVTLDPTVAGVNLGIARARLAVALAREARLRSEQAGAATPGFDYAPLPFPRPDTSAEEAGQRQIMAARAEVNSGRRDRLEQTKHSLNQQIAGAQGQIDAVKAQIALTEKDLSDIGSLVAKGLARQSQQHDLERSRAELYGRLATLEADAARARTAISDAEIEVLQADRAFKEGVVTELHETTSTVEELTLEVVNREAELKRMQILAPADGVVNQLQTSTAGAVIAPGATILEVVPTAEALDFEVRIDPRSIDQVQPGQEARLVLSALPRASTPDLIGKVRTVSADAIVDQVTGQRYYRAQIVVPPDEMAQIKDIELVPGMPVEAFLKTGDRSVLAYLLKPITDHMNSAFRED